jgi:hypothetical protein
VEENKVLALPVSFIRDKNVIEYITMARAGVDSASNRNEYQESLKIKKPGGKVRPARKADNLAAIY